MNSTWLIGYREVFDESTGAWTPLLRSNWVFALKLGGEGESLSDCHELPEAVALAPEQPLVIYANQLREVADHIPTALAVAATLAAKGDSYDA